MQKESGFGYKKRNIRVENMNEVYNIKHCIWCGRTGFKDSQEVIEHIKTKHTGQS